MLNPMQMRMDDVEVKECPKYLRDHPTENDHAIVVDSESEQLIIPLSLNGAESYVPIILPTMDEHNICHRMSLMAESPDWDLNTTSYSEEEAKATRIIENKKD